MNEIKGRGHLFLGGRAHTLLPIAFSASPAGIAQMCSGDTVLLEGEP